MNRISRYCKIYYIQIIELFEKYDKLTGVVSIEDVKSMNLYTIFHCTNDQIVSAEKFMADPSNLHGDNNTFILPDFIRFCSIIVHPLIKDNVFKKLLYTNFRIGNYYNLLNKNISDEDMGIGLSIEVNIDPNEDDVKSGDDDNVGIGGRNDDNIEIRDNVPRLNDQESDPTSISVISPISPPGTVNNKSNSVNIQILSQQQISTEQQPIESTISSQQQLS